MKPLAILLAAFSLIATLEAKESSSAKEKDKQKQKAKEEKKETRDKNREAVKAVLADKDKNGDGSLSKEEFISGEADPEEAAKRFDKFNKNGDRYLTKGEIEVMLGL